VNGYIHEEGMGGVRHALTRGRYRTALAMAVLATLILPTTYVRRLRTSLRYRFGRAKTGLWPGQGATPRAK
jgi:hypothetical protein